jgi:hypothetical protein
LVIDNPTNTSQLWRGLTGVNQRHLVEMSLAPENQQSVEAHESMTRAENGDSE